MGLRILGSMTSRLGDVGRELSCECAAEKQDAIEVLLLLALVLFLLFVLDLSLVPEQ